MNGFRGWLKRLWWLPAGLVAVTVLVSLLLPRSYRARTAFVPEAGGGGSQLAVMAAQLGVALPSADAAKSPHFYADLLRSPSVLRSLLLLRYDPDGPGPDPEAALVDLIGPRWKGAEDRLEEAASRLRRQLHVSVSLKTGVVTLLVDARTPWLARGVAVAALAAISEFDVRTRRSQGRVEREFVEARLDVARRELREIEDQLQSFLQGNREYRGSPRLTFQFDRLEREVAARRDVHATLLRAYEQARITEVRDTPSITVVDPPALPVRPMSLQLPLRTVLAGLVGLAGVWLMPMLGGRAQ